MLTQFFQKKYFFTHSLKSNSSSEDNATKSSKKIIIKHFIYFIKLNLIVYNQIYTYAIICGQNPDKIVSEFYTIILN